jgi:hypothetical protein
MEGERMTADIPDVLQPLLNEYVRVMEQKIPGLVSGVYLYGSIALGAFDPNFSDVDFIAVTQRHCTAQDVQALSEIHRELQQKYPQWALEGSYVQAQDLGQPENKIEPHPYIHDSVFNPAGAFDINPVTWWILKRHGITVFGTPPATLPFEVDIDQLIAYIHENLNSYWRQFTVNPHRILMLFSDRGVQWAVLGVLRQFYTLNERDIASKIGAGEYGLQCLPERWHRIIREALNIRRQGRPSLYRFRVMRVLDTVRFLRFISAKGNTIA